MSDCMCSGLKPCKTKEDTSYRVTEMSDSPRLHFQTLKLGYEWIENIMQGASEIFCDNKLVPHWLAKMSITGQYIQWDYHFSLILPSNTISVIPHSLHSYTWRPSGVERTRSHTLGCTVCCASGCITRLMLTAPLSLSALLAAVIACRALIQTIDCQYYVCHPMCVSELIQRPVRSE